MKVGEKCVGCGQCAAYCPYNAITIFGRANITDKCTECTVCMKYCPVRAILEDE